MHVDFISVAVPDDKEIGIEQIRQVSENSDAYPSVAPLKFIVVDGADRMTAAAANAFLKTLEEPSTSVRFFLLAEDVTRVLPTIRSRCGHVQFGRLPDSFILSTLQRFESDPTKAVVLSRMAEGSVGRAIRYWGSGQLGLRDRIVTLLTTAISGDLPSVLSQVSSIDKGLPLGLRVIDQLLHDLTMLQHDPSRVIHLDMIENLRKMRSKVPDTVWAKLSTGLKVVQGRRRYGKIDLPFHVQSLFVDTFFGK
jgi:DNA polymerase-3 subunit delta'